MSGPGIIAEEPEQMCEMCNTVSECRPYGPNDEQICFECAMLDEETTRKKMTAYIFLGND
jgi:hypothetical protein